MRQAFAAYAQTHEAASIRRCWSTWNTVCSYLYTSDLLPANPMELVGQPKPAKTLPKSLPPTAAQALLNAIDAPAANKRVTDWPERDRAIVFTALLAGLRAAELRGANIGDLRLTETGAVLDVRGKGNKTAPFRSSKPLSMSCTATSPAARRVSPIQPRSPHHHRPPQWPANAPLFVGRDGNRITRGALHYRVQRAFTLAGPDAQQTPGALVHALRHTYATELANANVSVYTLMKLLGHQSMSTSQRYVTSAGSETRAAAARNPLYDLARQHDCSMGNTNVDRQGCHLGEIDRKANPAPLPADHRCTVRSKSVRLLPTRQSASLSNQPDQAFSVARMMVHLALGAPS